MTPEPAERVHVSIEKVAELLDERAALVLSLVDGAGLAVDFVAAMLGMTETKTQKLLARARERLAELHGETNGSP